MLVALSILTSCNGQGNAQDKQAYFNPKSVSKLDPTIWNIYQDKKSIYWFGSKENGVYSYDGKDLKHFTISDGLISNEIRGIQEDKGGNLFFETTEGISKYDGQSFKTIEISDSPYNKWELNPDDLWFRIGFQKNGPYRYDGEKLHFLEFPESPQAINFYRERPTATFSPYGIYTIYKDREGSMWFGTSGLGLCRYDGKMHSWHYEDQLQRRNKGHIPTKEWFLLD